MRQTWWFETKGMAARFARKNNVREILEETSNNRRTGEIRMRFGVVVIGAVKR